VGEYFYETLKVKTKTLLSFIAEPMYYSKKDLSCCTQATQWFQMAKTHQE
jgi:hypothetical protein